METRPRGQRAPPPPPSAPPPRPHVTAAPRRCPGASQMPGAERRCWWRASPWARAEDKALKKACLQTPPCISAGGPPRPRSAEGSYGE
ncbi:putative uncharacterized protein BRD3OS isoform X1 [Panthera pardus]|uniref:Uncharacterized protein n=1 Tax=Panthera pardus TaxID=9691 RepID=A0A9W2W0L8_PANPR|nr:putative uncharacterized protein BRD3OS isoform X1 [Panthera pardus]